MAQVDYIWTGRRHIAWMELPFVYPVYHLSRDRLFREKGLFRREYEEVELYRVRDLQLTRSFFQRLFGTGTLRVYSTDATAPVLVMENIPEPDDVKEQIHKFSEALKFRRRIQAMEYLASRTYGTEPFEISGPESEPEPAPPSEQKPPSVLDFIGRTDLSDEDIEKLLNTQ